MHTVLSSASRTITIGHDQPFCIIGERINPTGRKTFQEQLRAGDYSAIEADVIAQVEGGATMLDVNMGAPMIDEPAALTAAVKLIQSVTDLPLCIDSSVVEALDAGLSAYQGKALVNSITAETERMDLILPLVKRHGAAIIALPNDEFEIPEEPERRLELTNVIVDYATTRYGIPIEDIVIDPLAMPIGADSTMVVRTLETIRLIRQHVGVNMTLGASNVSFGMPDRHTLNSVFLPMAMAAEAPGVTRATSAPTFSARIAPVRSRRSIMLTKERLTSAIAAQTPGERTEPPRSV
jgi:5-methyltetrahydrofolate--homocysteine methyltransferase